jgi:hypothetical protein
MSFSINGETWTPKTTLEHADSIIDKINDLLQENNVTDRDGNIVFLRKNYGNALYLLALGDGERFSENDEQLSKAINSFNIELCDDQQIENLLPIAAITRNPGSYSTLQLVAKASEDGDCLIPAGTKAPFNDVNFVVQADVLISAGSTQIVNTVCDTLGPVVVLSGEVTAFETEIANLESVENSTSSVPGVAPETTNALRRRILAGDTIKYSLNGCKKALEELTGITHARIYFNYNLSTTITLPGGVVVSPRTAYIVVLGSSDKIAETYAEYMNAPTQNDARAEGTYSTVTVTLVTGADGTVTVPAGTSVTYNGHVFETSAQEVIPASDSKDIVFTCTEWGEYEIPAYGINALDEEIANVTSVYNTDPAIPGTPDPKHSQDWVTSSGQSIPIKYDDAQKANIYIKVFVEENADASDNVKSQIKKDLIYASADWGIGETVTQVLACAPFVNCLYTDVAYVKISRDGTTWTDALEMDANEIPRITDATITIEQLGD